MIANVRRRRDVCSPLTTTGSILPTGAVVVAKFSIADGMISRDDFEEGTACLRGRNPESVREFRRFVAQRRVNIARGIMNNLKLEDCINETCPWSGDSVSADSLTTWEGHVVGFCNPGCRDKFEGAVRHFERSRVKSSTSAV